MAGGKNNRKARRLRAPVQLVFLAFSCVLAVWLLALPIYDVALERSSLQVQLNTGDAAPFTTTALGNPPPQGGDEQDVAMSDMAHLSDLEVVKHTKMQAEAQQALLDAKPNFDQEYCDRHFGNRWLQQWNTSAAIKCSPHQYRKEKMLNTFIKCRSIVDLHMPNASAPHVMCDATNLTVDPSLMTRANCPKHRPGYMCHRRTYHHYKPGAFKVACEWPELDVGEFPQDHLRDIFEAVELLKPGPALQQPELVISRPVLLVTRESLEYSNVFHTMTDILNAYITLRMLRWEQSPRSVILLDAHPTGPLDALWAALVAAGGTQAVKDPWGASTADGGALLRRVEDLPTPTLLRHAAFVPPGYASLLFAFLYTANECPIRTALFKDFRDWFLQGLNISPPQPLSIDTSLPIKVLFISRKPYALHRKMSRQIGNEAALLEGMRSVGGVEVEGVDLSTLPLLQQLHMVAHADVLVGMHGAALTFSLLQPPYGALVELWPHAQGMWRCFEHTAEWAGLLYRRWVNTDKDRERVTREGDVTEVEVTEVVNIMRELLPKVRRRRAAFAKEGEHGAVHSFLV